MSFDSTSAKTREKPGLKTWEDGLDILEVSLQLQDSVNKEQGEILPDSNQKQ